MTTTSFIKQSLGPLYAIAGKPDELRPLHTSLFNWKGLRNEIHEVSDLFGYFLITKKGFFRARLSALAESQASADKKGIKGGIKNEVLVQVEQEWNDMRPEEFLKYGVDTILPYELGNIEPDLGSENDPNFAWFGAKV